MLQGPLLIKVGCCRVATVNCQRLAYPECEIFGRQPRRRPVPRDLGSRCLVWNSRVENAGGHPLEKIILLCLIVGLIGVLAELSPVLTSQK